MEYENIFDEIQRLLPICCLKKTSSNQNLHLVNLISKLPLSESCDIPESESRGIKRLHVYLRQFIVSHLSEVIKEFEDLKNEDILKLYENRLKDYKMLVERMEKCFRYVDIWLKQSWLQYKYNLIGELCISNWSECILRPIIRHLNKTNLMLIEQERNGISIDSDLIKNVIDLCFAKELIYSTYFLEVYKEEFECIFLESIEQYYMKERDAFLQTSASIHDYIIEVEKWISDECLRAERFVHPTTLCQIKELLIQILVRTQNDLFLSILSQDISKNTYEDLNRVYRLAFHIPSGEENFLLLFENFAKTEGLKNIEKCGEAASKDAKLFIITFLNYRKKYCDLVKFSFENNTCFILALDNVFKSVINDNYVTKQIKGLHKPAQFLAQYCDSLLRKTLNFNSDIEYGLEDAIVLVNYLENLDVFKIFYKKMLSRRLLMNNSVSIEEEINMVSNLKQFSRLGSLSTLEKMLKDIEISKILNEGFMQFFKDSDEGLSVNFKVMLLTSGIWPTLKTDCCNFPPEVDKCIHLFNTFYVNKHKGRRLKWNFSLSNAEMITNCFRKRYTIQTSTFQMAVLLQFNNSLKLTVQQIHENTGIDMKSLYQVLQTLIQVKILEVKGSPNLNTKSEVSFNTLFMNKKLKLNINMPLKKQETKEDQDDIEKEVQEYRKILVEAAIVKVMKGAKRMDAQGLIAEMIKEFSSRFKVEVGLIKTCIEDLTRREFIEWSEEEKVYLYLA